MKALWSLEWRDEDGIWVLFDVYLTRSMARNVVSGWIGKGSTEEYRIRKWVRS